MESNATAWVPKLSLSEVDRIICGPGTPHEIETVHIEEQGVFRVYKNLPPSLRAFWLWATNEYKSKTYIAFEGEHLSYAEALTESVRAAAIFKEVYKVQKGDRIGICSRNLPSYITAFWACHLLGAIAVLINAWLPSPTLSFCMAHTQCKVVILDAERADIMARLTAKLPDVNGYIVIGTPNGNTNWNGMRTWADILGSYSKDASSIIKDDPVIDPEDNAVIMFTSGTTGTPKGVLSTQRAFLTNVPNCTIAIGRACLRRGEVLPIPNPNEPQKAALISVPLFHATGMQSFTLLSTALGMKIVLMRKWSVDEAVRLIVQENITSAGGVPTMVSELAEDPIAGKHLEGVSYGGASAPEVLAANSRRAFPNATVGQAYGLTETNSIAISVSGEDYFARPKCAGLPTPVNDVMVMRDGKSVPAGQSGEVWLRGPNIMKCYWADPDATAKALTKDGWFKSGDLGCLDSDGFLYILDRIKDIIIRGGENIDSVTVENALYANPDVLEAAAIGVPDEKLGEVVTALVVVRKEHRSAIDEMGLIAFARERLPKFAVPVMVIILDERFEKNASGKIVKQVLRKVAIEQWTKRKPGLTRL